MSELDDAQFTSWQFWDEYLARHMASGALYALRTLHGWDDDHLRGLAYSARLFPDVPYRPTRREPDGRPSPLRRQDMATAKTEGAKPEGKLNVHQKLHKIQTNVAEVEKGGWHSFQKFSYMQEHHIIQLLRPHLREVGATVTVDCGTDPPQLNATTFGKNNAPAFVTTLTGLLTFTDIDTGDSITARYVGQAIDSEGKGAGKAQTYLVKYALQKFFLVPTEHIDDEDAPPKTIDTPENVEAPGGQAPAPAQAGEDRIGTEAAEKILGILEREVNAKHLDPNKVKGKVATFRVPWSVEGLAQLTAEQKTQLAEWVGKEVHKATQPADGVPA